jgi:hypothetical protein
VHGNVVRGGIVIVKLATPAVLATMKALNRIGHGGAISMSSDWFVVLLHGGNVASGIAGTQAFGGQGVTHGRHGQLLMTTMTGLPGTVLTARFNVAGDGKHRFVHDVEPDVMPLIV